MASVFTQKFQTMLRKICSNTAFPLSFKLTYVGLEVANEEGFERHKTRPKVSSALGAREGGVAIFCARFARDE